MSTGTTSEASSPVALSPFGGRLAALKGSANRFHQAVAADATAAGSLERIKQRNKNEPEFLQAVEEVFVSMRPLFLKYPEYIAVLETLAEPERVIMFRVPWVDDSGTQRVNRGYRVQYSSALGPYKGGLRFHPSVNLSVLKFLGFEQILKNSLTGLPMGGGKGGSDFDPKGKSETEVLRFCQSFMTELQRHVGASTDVPAGDIGVGSREIGYLFGQYKRLTNRFDGVLTGKGLSWGGSRIRSQATGYGAVYFAECWINDHPNYSMKGAKCLISGSGNVAQYTAEKLFELGALPLTMSDSSGYIYDPEGITKEKLDFIKDLKNVRRGRIHEYCNEYRSAKFVSKKRPWEVAPDTAGQILIAFPSATQNEISKEDAESLIRSGCKLVVEGANMPSTPEAIALYAQHNVGFCPAKAANAGGVAVSGLEMAQNAARLSWTSEEVDSRLKSIMADIYRASKAAAAEFGEAENLQMGANIAGFTKVAEAIIEQGCV